MGSNPSTLRKNLYLTKGEIDNLISKNSINIIQSYKKLKNSDGLLTTNELSIMTYGLINAKTRKKIIQVCGSKSDKLNLNETIYNFSFISLDNNKHFEILLKNFSDNDLLLRDVLEETIGNILLRQFYNRKTCPSARPLCKFYILFQLDI